MSVPFTILLSSETLRLYASSPGLLTAEVECVSDSSAQSTLQFARNFMTSPDSFVAGERAGYRLPRLRDTQVEVIEKSPQLMGCPLGR